MRRGHFFRNPGSATATASLGRVDVEALVDPFALELDRDYDRAHVPRSSSEVTQ